MTAEAKPDDLTFRPLTRDELDIAIDWAAAEGWNPGLHDADVFWATDPQGFIAAELHGELVATGAIVSYGRRYGFMGLFIVRSDLRHRKLGTRLWFHRRDLLRARLDESAAIGMDGVFEMQPWYAKGGFTFSHRNLRMQGVGRRVTPEPGVVELRELPELDVAAYDTACFGCPRPGFLRQWLTLDDARSLGLVRSDRLAGFGTIRRCREGWKIGPLFADDAEAAEALYLALASEADGEPIWLDIPENNAAAVALAERQGLREVFGCARMYLGPPPDVPWDRIFGITSFELG